MYKTIATIARIATAKIAIVIYTYAPVLTAIINSALEELFPELVSDIPDILIAVFISASFIKFPTVSDVICLVALIFNVELSPGSILKLDLLVFAYSPFASLGQLLFDSPVIANPLGNLSTTLVIVPATCPTFVTTIL